MALLDAIFNKAKANFEKSCQDFTCYSLDDITQSTKVKAKIIDVEHCKIQFYHDVEKQLTCIKGRKFFVDKSNRIFVLLNDTKTTQKEEFIDGNKPITYDTIVIQFAYKTLELV